MKKGVRRIIVSPVPHIQFELKEITMKKKVFLLVVTVVLLASTVMTVYAGGTSTKCTITNTGGSIVSYSSLQYTGGTPSWVSTGVNMNVVGVNPPAASGGRTRYNTGFVDVSVSVPTGAHRGERIYSSCTYSYKLSGATYIVWTATSNTITIP